MVLTSDLTSRILAFLACAREEPSIRYLNRLIHRYVRRVPWESVTRIVKRNRTPETELCPRWPVEFWQEALQCGTGGTCFENNLAFFTLLNELGFGGYLTINDMENPACHTASVIALDGQRYLVDVAIPVHCALPLHIDKVTRRSTAFHHYTVRLAGEARYVIERSHHPKRRIFTLVDVPVGLEEYRGAVRKDYEETGYFLDRVIIVKVIGGRLWRFNSSDRPYKLEGFDKWSKEEIPLDRKQVAPSLAQHFGMAQDKIELALACVSADSRLESDRPQ